MTCKRCGAKETIKAHLIPKVFCREIQVGKMHAAGVVGSNKFIPTQSGIFDKNILCVKCDGELGALENYAAQMFRVIRENSKKTSYGVKEILNANPDKILRFAAGILWKYSLAEEGFGQIDLLGFDDDIKKYSYGEIDRPSYFDGYFFYLRLKKGSAEQFAYRAPFMTEIHGVNFFRFLLGGMLFFVKIDNKSLSSPESIELWLSNPGTLKFLLAPADKFEEFKIARELAFSPDKLSIFLDKNGS